ncbi:uncharacterized protein [Nicotiana sylvestris]|uniref:uncharacterized protein n=1 Tax=Nicotiana sylvestris TaxID=4096 RepID=UPI00388CBE1D
MVYAFNDAALRRKLWEDIKEIHEHMDEPWAVMGDFNCVLHKEERIGSPVTMAEIRDFKQCVADSLPDSEVFYRNEGTFDYCPTKIRWAEDQKKQHMFKYFNMWSITSNYKEIVKQGWKTNKNGKLRQLNKDKFSQIEKKVDQAHEELLQCQQRLQQVLLNPELHKEEERLIRKTKRLKSILEIEK